MILAFPDYAREQRFETDVVIVGTGAGGATVGSELAQAGIRVTFVEEGGWHPTSTFSPYTAESVPRLYRDGGGTVILGKPPIPYVEGRCVGGSTVINGGMAYRAPDAILEGWARDTGATELSPRGLEPFFERAEQRVSAKRQRPESVGGDNHIMREGARRMGWEYSENPRNQQECVGSNNCVLGCPTGAKQSTLVTFMPTAMAAGARCLTEIRVDRLIIEGGRCVGVAGHAIDPRTMRRATPVEVRASAVVIACGAIQTPHLLLKHRLSRQSGQLGRNFLCHPNVKLIGLFPFDVKAWQGVAQVGQVREFHDEGIVLAENFIPPAAMATQLPALGRRSWEVMRRYNQAVVGGCLVEDSTTGARATGPLRHGHRDLQRHGPRPRPLPEGVAALGRDVVRDGRGGGAAALREPAIHQIPRRHQANRRVADQDERGGAVHPAPDGHGSHGRAAGGLGHQPLGRAVGSAGLPRRRRQRLPDRHRREPADHHHGHGDAHRHAAGGEPRAGEASGVRSRPPVAAGGR
jgi:ferredoxin